MVLASAKVTVMISVVLFIASVFRRWSLYWSESLSQSQINLINVMILCICLSFVKQVHVLLWGQNYFPFFFYIKLLTCRLVILLCLDNIIWFKLRINQNCLYLFNLTKCLIAWRESLCICLAYGYIHGSSVFMWLCVSLPHELL